MLLLNTMRALEILPLTLPSWKRNVNNRGLERALAILSMRSYAIGRLHDFASEPFSAGFRTNSCGKHRNGSTQKAPRQQTFKFEEVRGRHHREARSYTGLGPTLSFPQWSFTEFLWSYRQTTPRHGPVGPRQHAWHHDVSIGVARAWTAAGL